MGQTDRRRRRYRQLLTAIGAVAAALCLTIFVLQRSKSPGPDAYEPAGTYKPTPADHTVREKLKSSITSLDLGGVKLRQAIGELREISGARIRVNWPALAKERVQPETAVEVHLKNVTLSKAIQTVLDDCLCIGDRRRGETGLGHVVEDGAVTISSKLELVTHVDTREYDVRDITALVLGFRRRQAEARGNDADSIDETLRDDIASDITNLITGSSNDYFWDNPKRDVSEKGEKLVVTQSTAYHEWIVALLEKVRRRLNNRSSDPRPEKPAASDTAVRERLNSKIGEFDFYNTELRKAINAIRDRSGVNISVRWSPIAREFVRPDTKVSVYSANKKHHDGVRLKNATFAESLHAVCSDAASEGEPGIGLVGLDYTVRDGVVTVSTKNDLRDDLRIRIYDIGDMISNLVAAGGERRSYAEIVAGIKTLIVETIDPMCGMGCHGGKGAIYEIGGLLVVTRTIENHESLAGLLGELHANLSRRGPETHSAVMSPRDCLARKQLGERVTKFCAEDIELWQVIQFFRDVSGVAVNVDWRALSQEGVDRETSVNIFFPSGISSGRALRTVLASLVDEASTIRHVIRDGELTISTSDGLKGRDEFRVYDVRDLIALVRKNEGPSLGQAEASGEICNLISDTIDLESWRPAGGFGGLHEIGGLLVISQTIDNHQAIAELLGNLRRHFKTRNLAPHSHIETQDERAIRKQFEAKIAKLDLDDVQFCKAIEALCDDPGLGLYANWHSFAAGISRKTIPVRVRLKNITLREAIDAVFDNVNKGDSLRTNYVVAGGVMWIAPEYRLRNWSVMRIYDARDLIARKMKSTTAPAQARDKTVKEIIDLIRETINPGSWRYDGGSLGTIHEIGGLLVVNQTHRHHNSLAELLKKLRAGGK